MRLFRYVGLFLVVSMVLMPVGHARTRENVKKKAGDMFIEKFEYAEGTSFKIAITEICDFDFESISKITIIHAPVHGRPRTEKVYTDEKMLKEANELLDFTPDNCRVINKLSSGWTECIVFEYSVGARFAVRHTPTGMRALNFLYVDYEETDIYSALRALFP